ncbi:MAG TPA: type II secretion system protein [Planctomicrobium sp.]|nr:type II secretion system protein [Planctomicrobium sp.]
MKRSPDFITGIHVAASARSRLNRANGFTLIECIVAMGLLVAFSAMTVPMIARLQQARQEQFRRQLALTEVQNLLESKSFPDDGGIQLRESLRTWLPDAQVEIRQSPDNSNIDAEQVTVSIRWKMDSGVVSRPVFLTTWIFKNTVEADPSSNENQE